MGISAQELRIGNSVSHNGKIIKIAQLLADCAYNEHDFESYWYDELEPISITEERLLQFGFKYREFLNDFFIKLDDHNILIAEKEIIGFAIYKCEPNDRKYFLTKRYYVHQLQNLFHSLTGQELAIKQLKDA